LEEMSVFLKFLTNKLYPSYKGKEINFNSTLVSQIHQNISENTNYLIEKENVLIGQVYEELIEGICSIKGLDSD
jgi:hypothetical protein